MEDPKNDPKGKRKEVSSSSEGQNSDDQGGGSGDDRDEPPPAKVQRTGPEDRLPPPDQAYEIYSEMLQRGVGSFRAAEETVSYLLQKLNQAPTEDTRRNIIRRAVTWALLEDAPKRMQQIGLTDEMTALLKALLPWDAPDDDAVDETATSLLSTARRWRVEEVKSRLCREWRDETEQEKRVLRSELNLEYLQEAWHDANDSRDAKADVLVRISNTMKMREQLKYQRWLRSIAVGDSLTAVLHDVLERPEWSIFVQELLSLIHKAPLGEGLVIWKQPSHPEVELKLTPVQPERMVRVLSIPLALGLDTTRVQHATNTEALLKMIVDAVSDNAFTLQGQRKEDQYAGIPLVWFGIDLQSVPTVKSRLEDTSLDEASRQKAKDHIEENRYGCAVISLPLRSILDSQPEQKLWMLRERQYKHELSQALLLSARQPWSLLCVDLPLDQVKTDLQEIPATDPLRWPFNLHYHGELPKQKDRYRWSHPEFAVAQSVRIPRLSASAKGLKIRFADHNGMCVPSAKKPGSCECHDSELTKEAGRHLFLNRVLAKDYAVLEAVRLFGAWGVFEQEDWCIISRVLASASAISSSLPFQVQGSGTTPNVNAAPSDVAQSSSSSSSTSAATEHPLAHLGQ